MNQNVGEVNKDQVMTARLIRNLDINLGNGEPLSVLS